MNYIETSYVKQVLVGLVDAAFSLIAVTTLLVTRYPDMLYTYLINIDATLLVLLFFVFYRLSSLLFFNQTMGMKLFHTTLLNGEQQPLNGLEKVLAAFCVLYRGVNYYQRK
jgi:hypothetical protein